MKGGECGDRMTFEKFFWEMTLEELETAKRLIESCQDCAICRKDVEKIEKLIEEKVARNMAQKGQKNPSAH